MASHDDNQAMAQNEELETTPKDKLKQLVEHLETCSKETGLSLEYLVSRHQKFLLEQKRWLECNWQRQDDVTQLKVEVKILRSDRSKHEKIIEELKDKLRKAEKEHRTSQHKLQEQLEAKAKTEKDALLKQHETAVKQLEKMLNSESESCKRFVSYNEDKEKEISQLKHDIQKSMETLLEKEKEFKSALAEKDKKIKEGKDQLNQQFKMFQEKLKVEKLNMKEVREAKEKAVQNHSLEISKEKTIQEELNKKIQELENQINALNVQLKDRKISAKKEHDELTKSNKLLYKNFDSLKRNIRQKENIISKLETEIKELTAYKNTLETKVKIQEKDSLKKLNEIKKEQDKSAVLKAIIQERNDMIKKLEKDLEDDQTEELTKTIASLRSELRKQRSKYRTVLSRQQNIRPEVERWQKKYKHLENKNISMQRDIQKCVDVFQSRTEFLHCFRKLMEHLDTTEMEQENSLCETLKGETARIKSTCQNTIAIKTRTEERLTAILSKMSIVPLDLSKHTEAIKESWKLEEEKQALKKELQTTQTKLEIAQRPVKSKVQSWFNKTFRRDNKVHPARTCSLNEEVQARRPIPCFETPLKVSTALKPGTVRMTPPQTTVPQNSPETSSPPPSRHIINYIPDGI